MFEKILQGILNSTEAIVFSHKEHFVKLYNYAINLQGSLAKLLSCEMALSHFHSLVISFSDCFASNTVLLSCHNQACTFLFVCLLLVLI